jgi:myo-inositol catabolism protein IolS
MQYRMLGKTGWKVSAVSMGCWALGPEWGGIPEKQGIEAIHESLDLGVNLFDVADVYGMGYSEEVLGKALKGKRDGLYIATKLGHWGRHYDDGFSWKSVYSAINCCHASLHRLGIETIDLYQCHVQEPPHPDVLLEAMEKLKEQGKIRHYGISTDQLPSVKKFNENGQCAICQLNYSILNRSAEKELLPYCRENGIGVLLRGPIFQGMLADKFDENTVFTDVVRSAKWNKGAHSREDFLKHLKTEEQLRPLARDGRSMIDVALQFTLANPAVTCPIPSAKSPAQARQNAAAAEGALGADELALIDSVSPPPE